MCRQMARDVPCEQGMWGLAVGLAGSSGFSECRYRTVMCMLWSRDVSLDLRRLKPSVPLSAADRAFRPCTERRPDMARPSALVLTLIATVVVLDQAAKWWAWRHVPGARINSGGDMLVGSTIGRWYAAPVTGALLDLLDFGLLSLAVTFLMRFRTLAVVAIPGALMIGGWGSNLLDRLGVHYWTAPGSVRGAVDFIHLHGQYYNVADFFIISCTPVFLLAALYQGVRAVTGAPGRQVMRPAAVRNVLPRARRRVWARVRIPALTAAGLVLVVSLGAAHYGGVNTASCTLTHLNGSAATSAAAVPLSVC